MLHNSYVNSVFSELSAMYYSKNAFINILTFLSLQTCIQIHLNMCYAIIYFMEIIPEEISRLVGSFMVWTPRYIITDCLILNRAVDAEHLNTLRTGDANLRFYITTVQDGWRKSAFLIRACFPWTIHLIMQYIEPVSEWSCWQMFIEIWPHSELTFRHRASSI